MRAKDVVDELGGAGKAAEICGVTPQAVYQWIAKGLIPVEQCPKIQAERPDLTCERIRPDKLAFWQAVRHHRAAA